MTPTQRAPAAVKLPGTPQPWMNRMMRVAMHTPGLRRLLGRTFAEITVTGARSGRRYTTPVQFVRVGRAYVVLSQGHRMWWRNLREVPSAILDVAGTTLSGTATVAELDDARVPIADVLRAAPRVAKFYGIALDDGGEPDPDGVDALAERVVAITFVPT